MVIEEFLAPWEGVACRHIRDDSPYAITDFRFAGQAPDNRWNEPGEPTLYLASDHGVLIAEFARHAQTVLGHQASRRTFRRRIYELSVRVDVLLDLRVAEHAAALGLHNAPQCFLDRDIARATAASLRRNTPAQAILVPSMAFLDDLARWVMVLFLEKLPVDPSRFLTSVEVNGTFRLEP